MYRAHTTQRRRGLLWAAALLAVSLLLLAVATLLPTGRIARSTTTHNTTIASGRTPSGAVLPQQTVSFALEGDGPLIAALADALAAQPNLQPVADGATPDAIIAVEPTATDVLWTPLFVEGTVKATVAFSSNGEFGFRESDPARFEFASDDAGPIVQFDADITVSDRSIGWISRPAAYRWLADTIAAEAANAVQTHAFAAP